MFSIFIEIDNKNGISKNGIKPWNHPEINLFTTKLFKNNIVIMGRKTWDNLQVRPIPESLNIVISQNCNLKECKYAEIILESVDSCINYFSDNHREKRKFIIGGKSLYEQFLTKNVIHELYIVHIKKDYTCDNHLELNTCMSNNSRIINTTNTELSFHKYHVLNLEEMEIISTMKHIITNGNKRIDTNGNYIMSIFNKEFRFDLSKWNIPLMTTQPMSFKIIFDELMCILRGQPDTNIIDKNYINNEDIICNSYGLSMRNYGLLNMNSKPYLTNMNDNSNTSGFDQLTYVINLLINDPYSNKIIINLWNPAQLHTTKVCPILYGYQFYVNDNKLSVKLIQRASDIAVYGTHACAIGALFVFMLCSITGLVPGEIIWSLSNIYICENCIDSVKLQIERPAKPFPIIQIIKRPEKNNILNFEYNHFKLNNYDPHTF